METQNDINGFQHMRAETLRQRYLRKDKNGTIIETEDKMFRRVARVIATVERLYGASLEKIRALKNKFYQIMKRKEFLPNSPTLINAGRPNGMLSACFVLPVRDSVDGIFDAIKNTAIIQKAGGGTGFDFSQLRPTGDIVTSSGGKTSGPISFLRVFAETTNAIQQGAFRRGANMGMMSIDHPDILKFINAKQDPKAFTNFNISVKVPDDFMARLSENPNSPHIVVNPRTKRKYVIPRSIDIITYTINDLIPVEKDYSDYYTVKDVWVLIIKNAHATGEPGVCFIDRINENNPTPRVGKIEASNPCGEQPLLPYESCNLGSINISKFINEKKTDLDWERLAEVIPLAVRFLDNVIDANHFPIPEIKTITLGNRKIGLGIMGFADALILMNISYVWHDTTKLATRISRFINEHAHQASEELAKERGCFPNWKESIWNTKFNRPMRNAAVSTIAPTGSISIIAECSSGIEPIYSYTYKRRALDGSEFTQIHPLLERLGAECGWLNEKTKAMLLEGKKLHEIPGIPEELIDILVTAYDVLPDHHIEIQAAFQSNVDNAISKTINLPASTPVEEIDNIFRYAHKKGCKGTTVYRDRSRDNQVISAGYQLEKATIHMLSPRPRPKKTTGKTIKSRTGCGTLFITVNNDDNGLCEVFANLGKAGGCPSQSEATCRVVSAALRCGVEPEVLIEQLKNIRCLSTITRKKTNNDIDVLSCPDAIARAIEESLEECEPLISTSQNKCPECGYPLRRESGCNICDKCGFDKCG